MQGDRDPEKQKVGPQGGGENRRVRKPLDRGTPSVPRVAPGVGGIPPAGRQTLRGSESKFCFTPWTAPSGTPRQTQKLQTWVRGRGEHMMNRPAVGLIVGMGTGLGETRAEAGIGVRTDGTAGGGARTPSLAPPRADWKCGICPAPQGPGAWQVGTLCDL